MVIRVQQDTDIYRIEGDGSNGTEPFRISFDRRNRDQVEKAVASVVKRSGCDPSDLHEQLRQVINPEGLGDGVYEPVPIWDLLRQPRKPDLVSGVLRRGDFVVLYGESGTGKSYLLLYLSMCIAQGTPWLGNSVEKGPALYFSCEDGAEITAERTFAGNGLRYPEEGDDLLENLLIFDGSINIFDSDDVDRVLRTVDEHEPLIVGLDTLTHIWGDPSKSENSAEAMGHVVRVSQSIAKRGPTVVLVHHTTKEGGRERGSSALFNGASVVMRTDKDTAGNCTVTSCKSKGSRLFNRISYGFESVDWDREIEGTNRMERVFNRCVVKREGESTKRYNDARELLLPEIRKASDTGHKHSITSLAKLKLPGFKGHKQVTDGVELLVSNNDVLAMTDDKGYVRYVVNPNPPDEGPGS